MKKQYKEGDTVRYATAGVKMLDGSSVRSLIKEGTIEEVMTDSAGETCYWIKNENFIVWQKQIVE